jgi:hypothetical protein
MEVQPTRRGETGLAGGQHERRRLDNGRREELLDGAMFCCRRDQAITIEERSSTAFYRLGRGLMHGRCPGPGTAPRVPPRERAARVARYAKAHA